MDKLSIGRIVHFVFQDEETKELKTRPAIVVQVWSDDCANLQVFTDSDNDKQSNTEWKTSVIYSEEPKPYSWHWPNRS